MKAFADEFLFQDHLQHYNILGGNHNELQQEDCF